MTEVHLFMMSGLSLHLKLIIKVANINFKYKKLHICPCQKMGGSQEMVFGLLRDKNASNQRISLMTVRPLSLCYGYIIFA